MMVFWEGGYGVKPVSEAEIYLLGLSLSWSTRNHIDVKVNFVSYHASIVIFKSKTHQLFVLEIIKHFNVSLLGFLLFFVHLSPKSINASHFKQLLSIYLPCVTVQTIQNPQISSVM